MRCGVGTEVTTQAAGGRTSLLCPKSLLTDKHKYYLNLYIWDRSYNEPFCCTCASKCLFCSWYFVLIRFFLKDITRMEKSPLLANGYNHPPHLGHMQFMQLPHPAAAHSALLSPAMPHNLARPDGSVIKNQGMHTMEAIARFALN